MEIEEPVLRPDRLGDPGGGQIMVFEFVMNAPQAYVPNEVHDCCSWVRSIKYTIGVDHKIKDVAILNAPQAAIVHDGQRQRPAQRRRLNPQP